MTHAVEKKMKPDIMNGDSPVEELANGETVEAKEETAPGMLAKSVPMYQQEDKKGRFQWVTTEPEDVLDAAENAETAKYAFLVRKKKSYDSRKKYDIDSVVIQSPLLKAALGIALKDYPGVTTTLARLEFRAPFQPLVHRWLDFTSLMEQSAEGEALTYSHLKLFHDTMHDELKEAIYAKNDMVKNGVITFGYLWTLFEPGCLVYSTNEGKDRLYELNTTSTCHDSRRGLDYLRIQAWCVDFDGEKFGRRTENLANYEFEGTKKITSLEVFPLDFHPQKRRLLEILRVRGTLFEKFAGYHYQAYSGIALGYGGGGMIRYNISSRIIIDTDAHNKFLPNRAVSCAALGKPIGKNAMSQFENSDEEDMGSDYYGSDGDDDGNEDDNDIDTPSTNREAKTLKRRPLTAKELLLAVPFVRGYALKSKKWLWFFVDQVQDIKFAENAFESLVLPQAQKKLIRAFVESQVKYKDTFDDVIEGKGRGMIMLLSGSPGVGKTLTAESVAENLKTPLYMMSAGDLGLDPSSIESSLGTVLEMVAKWNAVLLLDEADVFLEARSTHDLERNRVVSIFLRVLEYYEGILFLTTNRIKHIDEAFHSRIHVSINYPPLSIESRKHVWTNFLGKSGVSVEELNELAEVDLNGRQIKNLLKTAQMLSKSEGHDIVTIEHIRTVLTI